MKKRSSRLRRPKLTSLAIVSVAFVLLWLSVPNAIAGIALMFGDPIKHDYLANREGDPEARPTDAELLAWRASREQALLWADIPEVHIDLSLVTLLQARDETDLAMRTALTQLARDHLIDAVARDPTNGFVWMRLGLMDSMTQQPPNIALASLRASLETAPYQPTLIGQRLRFGFRYWPNADEALRAVLLEQLKLLVVAGRMEGIDRLVRENPFYVPLIREQFDGSTSVQQRIDRISSE